MDLSVAFRVASGEKDDLLQVLNADSASEFLEVGRVQTWRSDTSYLDVAIALTSAGSLAFIGQLIKTWVNRNNGSIEVINTKSGVKIKFDGPLTQAPVVEIERLLITDEDDKPIEG